MSIRFVSLALLALVGCMQHVSGAAIAPRAWYKLLSTPHGDVSGLATSYGTRYTVPYARPPIGTRRFQDPVPVANYSLYPGGDLAPVCYQVVNESTGETTGSEDCLYLTVYAPTSVTSTSKYPVVTWIHGGSFTSGGAADLDPGAFANSQHVIVVVVQYRLGALGFLKYDTLGLDGNYGLKDVILALKWIQSDISAYGGNPAQVTLAGQSSGAEIIKSLLVTPSATSLFTRAILQSAPLDTVDQTVAIANAVGQRLVSIFGSKSLSELQALPISQIMLNQTALVQDNRANFASYGTATSEPLRIVIDGKLVTRDFRTVVSSGGKLEGSTKDLIFTTVKNEGCLTIGGLLTSPLDVTETGYFDYLIAYAYPSRAASIIDSGLYDPSLLPNDTDASRDQLAALATDFSWTCSNQLTAKSLSKSNTGKIYLGEFDLGVSFYPAGVMPFCDGKVSHQDDIYTIFTDPYGRTLTAQQSNLVAEVQARWGAFAKNGVPTSGSSTWPTVSSSTSDLNVLVLGGASTGKSTTSKTQRTAQCAAYTFA